MLRIGAMFTIASGLSLLLLSRTNSDFALILWAALGIPAIVALPIGVLLLVASFWGIMGWPGRPIVLGVLCLTALKVLGDFLHF